MSKTFDIAFYYQAVVLMKGARESKEVFIQDSVLVEIPTATIHEAPLAVDIEIPQGGWSNRNQFLGFGGSLYKDLKKIGHEGRELSGEEVLQLCADDPKLTRALFHASDDLVEDRPDSHLWKKIKGQVFGAFPNRVHTLIESDRDRIVSNLHRMAGMMLIVGDRLYGKTPCPMIGVWMNSKRSSANGYVTTRHSNSGRVLFSLKRHAEAEQFVSDMAPEAPYPTRYMVRKFREDLVGDIHEADMNAIAIVNGIRANAEECMQRLTPEGLEALGRLTRFAKAAERHDPGAADRIATDLAGMRGEHYWLEDIKDTDHWGREKAANENAELINMIDYGLESLLRTPGVNLTVDDDMSLSAF